MPEHLRRRKEFQKSLRKAAADWFRARGKQVNQDKAYILHASECWSDNIISPRVVDYIADNRVRRDNDLHHGLSSQAMLFNLIGPLIVNDDFAALSEAFDDAGIATPTGVVSAQFECEDRNVFAESRSQPTSIDLVVEAENIRLYMEAKLQEAEFGGCSIFKDGDCDGRNPAAEFSLCYLHESANRTYWRQMQRLGFLEGNVADSPICYMALHYQFFREVMFALIKAGMFILLADRRSPVFVKDDGGRGLFPLLVSTVPEQFRDRIKLLTVQDAVSSIKNSGRHDSWIDEFRKKYGLTEP